MFAIEMEYQHVKSETQLNVFNYSGKFEIQIANICTSARCREKKSRLFNQLLNVYACVMNLLFRLLQPTPFSSAAVVFFTAEMIPVGNKVCKQFLDARENILCVSPSQSIWIFKICRNWAAMRRNVCKNDCLYIE